MSIVDNFLNTLPSYPVLRERFNYLVEVFDDDLLTMGETDTYEWGKVEDGAGNEVVLILLKGREEALLFAFDNENSLNFYAGAQYEQVVFNGIPEQFQEVLDDGTFLWPFLSDKDRQIVYATHAFWFTDGVWHVSQDYADTVDWEGDVIPSARYALVPFAGDEKNVEEFWDSRID